MVGVGLDEAGAVKLASMVCSQLARTSVPKALVIVRNADAIADMRAMHDMTQLHERGLLDAIVVPTTLRHYLLGFLREHRQIPPASPRPTLCL
jgi:hypothetical protein